MIQHQQASNQPTITVESIRTKNMVRIFMLNKEKSKMTSVTTDRTYPPRERWISFNGMPVKEKHVLA